MIVMNLYFVPITTERMRVKVVSYKILICVCVCVCRVSAWKNNLVNDCDIVIDIKADYTVGGGAGDRRISILSRRAKYRYLIGLGKAREI